MERAVSLPCLVGHSSETWIFTNGSWSSWAFMGQWFYNIVKGPRLGLWKWKRCRTCGWPRWSRWHPNRRLNRWDIAIIQFGIGAGTVSLILIMINQGVTRCVLARSTWFLKYMPSKCQVVMVRGFCVYHQVNMRLFLREFSRRARCWRILSGVCCCKPFWGMKTSYGQWPAGHEGRGKHTIRGEPDGSARPGAATALGAACEERREGPISPFVLEKVWGPSCSYTGEPLKELHSMWDNSYGQC